MATVQVFVRDKTTAEPIRGANVTIGTSNVGVTDAAGRCTVNSIAGALVTVSHAAYKNGSMTIAGNMGGIGILNIFLERSGNLDPVVITPGGNNDAVKYGLLALLILAGLKAAKVI